MSGKSFLGKVNIYVCDRCHGHIVTRDKDEGVTPFMLVCLATEGCPGRMKSSMYNVFDQTMREDFVWKRATSEQVIAMKRGERSHHEKGGLFLFKPAGQRRL